MLYGFPPRERGALADKNRYAPWSLSPMRGTLALTCQKGDITLQRDTARANSPMGRFSAVYTGSSETVDGLTAADCGETLLGVPCEVYERSAFIRQSSLTVDASAELERRIAALITTGEEGQSFSEASAALKKQLNARKYNKSGRIPALAAEISAQERALEELSQLTRSKRKAEEALASFDAEEASLREQLRAHDLCDAQDARRAAQLEPNNTEYQMHLRNLQNPGQTYRTQTTYAQPGGLMRWCWSMILLNLLCNCCCGGGWGWRFRM